MFRYRASVVPGLRKPCTNPGGAATQEHLPNGGVLDDEELVALAELGRSLEETFGGPQDVEWAIADGELYLLQSRPVTTL